MKSDNLQIQEELLKKNVEEIEQQNQNEEDSQKDNTFLLRFNHEDLEFDEDTVKKLAQKGLNYDKIKAQLDRYEDCTQELEEFFREHAELTADKFPQEVFDAFVKGTPIKNAYESYEKNAKISELEQQITELTNKLNAVSGAPSVSSFGTTQRDDIYTEEQLNSLTVSEIRKNLDKALKSMSMISKKK